MHHRKFGPNPDTIKNKTNHRRSEKTKPFSSDQSSQPSSPHHHAIVFKKVLPPTPKGCRDANGQLHKTFLTVKALNQELYAKNYGGMIKPNHNNNHTTHNNIASLDDIELDDDENDNDDDPPKDSMQQAADEYFRKYFTFCKRRKRLSLMNSSQRGSLYETSAGRSFVSSQSNLLSDDDDDAASTVGSPATTTTMLRTEGTMSAYNNNNNETSSSSTKKAITHNHHHHGRRRLMAVTLPLICVIAIKLWRQRAYLTVLEKRAMAHYTEKIVMQRRCRRVLQFWLSLRRARRCYDKRLVKKSWAILLIHHGEMKSLKLGCGYRLQQMIVYEWFRKTFFLWRRYTVMQRCIEQHKLLPSARSFPGPVYPEWEYLHRTLVLMSIKNQTHAAKIVERRRHTFQMAFSFWRSWAKRRLIKMKLRQKADKHCNVLRVKDTWEKWRLRQCYHVLQKNFVRPFALEALRAWRLYVWRKKTLSEIRLQRHLDQTKTLFLSFCDKFSQSSECTRRGVAKIMCLRRGQSFRHQGYSNGAASTGTSPIFWMLVMTFSCCHGEDGNSLRLHLVLLKCFAKLRLHGLWRIATRTLLPGGMDPNKIESCIQSWDPSIAATKSRTAGDLKALEVWVGVRPNIPMERWGAEGVDVGAVPLSPWALHHVVSIGGVTPSSSPPPVKKSVTALLQRCRTHKKEYVNPPSSSTLAAYPDIPMPYLVDVVQDVHRSTQMMLSRDITLLRMMNCRILCARLMHLTGGRADPRGATVDIEVTSKYKQKLLEEVKRPQVYHHVRYRIDDDLTYEERSQSMIKEVCELGQDLVWGWRSLLAVEEAQERRQIVKLAAQSKMRVQQLALMKSRGRGNTQQGQKKKLFPFLPSKQSSPTV